MSTDGKTPRRRCGLTGLRTGRRLRRRTRWALRVVVGVPLVAVLLIAVGLRSPLVMVLLRSSIESSLGCRFRAGSAVVALDGRLVLDRVRLVIPTLDGPESEFLTARHAEVDIDWSGVLTGSPRPVALRLYDPVFRLSVDADSGHLNLDELKPAVSGRGAGMQPPRIGAFGGRVEIGEHDRTGARPYAPLKTMFVDGDLTVSDPRRLVYEVKLQEMVLPRAGERSKGEHPVAGGPHEHDRGMFLEGRIDLQTTAAEFKLHNLGFDDWPASAVPTSMRELWRRLNIQGEISLATFSYSPAAGVAAQANVSSVSMNALVPADRPEVAGDQVLELAGVNGEIRLSRAGLRAELAGRIGDLPCRVALRTEGTDLNAPLRCEITTERFEVQRNPMLLPYAPPVVRKHFARFSGPTAKVDARVVIERGPGTVENGAEGGSTGAPGPITVSGSLAFQEGTAAFEAFPYPVHNLGGLVTFSDQKVELVSIRGRGETGAIVSATGVIAPPSDEAAVHIEVLALDVPVDHVLEQTFTPEQRELLSALFNREQHARLVERGLIRPVGGGSGGELAAGAARMNESAPPFEFGGVADLAITIDAPPGKHKPYTHTVQIRMDKAGMVPGAFPLPINARNVSLTLDEHQIVLNSGQFTGLRGGAADLDAQIHFGEPDAPGFRPHVRVRAEQIPVDDLLINALPDDRAAARLAAAGAGTGGDAPSAAAPPFSAKGLLEGLHIAGTVSCTAELSTGPDGRTHTDAVVELNHLRASPRTGAHPTGGCIALEGLTGTIHVTEGGISIAGLSAALASDTGAAGATAGRLTLDLDAALAHPMGLPRGSEALPPAGAGRIAAAVGLRDLDVGAPIEELVDLFSPSSARLIRDLRIARRPAGRVDGLVALAQAGDEPPRVEVRINAGRGVEADALGGRVGVEHRSGTVRVMPGALPRLAFDDAIVQMGLDGGAPAMVSLDGSITIPTGAGPAVAAANASDTLGMGRVDERLEVGLRDASFENTLIRAILTHPALSSPEMAGAGGAIARFDPWGVFDADIAVRGVGAGPATGGAGRGAYSVSGRVTPRSLSFVRNGERLDLGRLDGHVTFDGRAGRFELLRAETPAWSVGLDGDWRAGENGLGVDTTVRVDAKGLPEDLRRALPEAVRQQLQRLEVRIDGPWSLRDARYSLSPGSGGTSDDMDFTGTLTFEDAAFDAGLSIERCRGELGIDLRQGRDDAAPAFALDFRAESMTVADLPATNAIARVVSGSAPGQVVLPRLSADFFGGRAAASAMVRTEANDGGPSYHADVTIAGARFAPLLAALAAKTPGLAERSAAAHANDETRGRLDASLSITGIPGVPQSRSGRGSIRVAGGDVIRLPLILQLVQLSNFQLPSDERLDYLQTAFDLRAERLRFEQIAVMSEGLSILGSGTVMWPDLELDLQFNSQAAPSRRIPIWSDLFETLRDELITTVVSGTLRDPQFSTATLSGTRRMLAGLFGGSDHDDARAEANGDERAARLERRRLREAATKAAPSVVMPTTPEASSRPPSPPRASGLLP